MLHHGSLSCLNLPFQQATSLQPGEGEGLSSFLAFAVRAGDGTAVFSNLFGYNKVDIV